MNLKLEALHQRGIEIEEASYTPWGINADGAPYEIKKEYNSFIDAVMDAVGEETFIKYIEELGGDSNCGNWILVAALKLSTVPLRTEPVGYWKK